MAVDFDNMGKALLAEIKELDEKLDSYQDPSALGKRTVTTSLIKEYEASWKPVADKLIENLTSVEDEEKRIGVFLGLQKALRDSQYSDLSVKFVEAAVESQPKTEVVEVSDDEKKAVAAERSEKYGQFKALRTLLVEAFGKIDADDPEWAMPPVRRANVGKRGARAINQMTWAINGEALDPEETTYKKVAESLGFTLAKDLTSALKAAGVNTSKPGEGFDVTVNGKNVVATLPEGITPQFPDPEGDTTDDSEEDDD